MKNKAILACLWALLLVLITQARETKTDTTAPFPSRLLKPLNHKVVAINRQLDKHTALYLKRMLKQEKEIKRLLFTFDSVKAGDCFSNIEDQYAAVQNSYNDTAQQNVTKRGSQYFPYLDSIKCAFGFLDQNKKLLSAAPGQDLQQSINQVDVLQNKLGSTAEIRQFINERKKLISETLAQYTSLPKNITRQYSQFSKQAYYYSARVREYKAMLNEPGKIEKTALQIVSRLPAFKDFMNRYSFLSAMFPVPDNYGTTAALTGLQSRADIQQMLDGRLAMGGPNAMNALQQNLQAAQSQLSSLKDKINKLGGTSDDIEMLDFQPNQQKTKSFLQRLELGGNIQTQRSNNYFPVTSDISFSLGYRISDKSIIGVGTGYKIGLGKNIRHIAFTSEGMNLRSFADVKLKGSIWITGGAELNYRSRFNSFEELKNESAWSPSILAGLSKKYGISKKVKGEFKLLCDALWRQQVPQGQPVVFRVGYSLK